MPQIQLKQNSPEFAERDMLRVSPKAPPCPCDMPGCPHQGLYKAPKDRSLSNYYTFCLDHVQEYNAAWNFFAGMPDHDIEHHIIESMYGHRPTWRADSYRGLEAELHRKIHQKRFFTEEDPADNATHDSPPRITGNPTLDALNVLSLTMPVTFNDIKKRYRDLVKKHHPDRQNVIGPDKDKNEEILKRINMAYTILKMTYAGHAP